MKVLLIVWRYLTSVFLPINLFDMFCQIINLLLIFEIKEKKIGSIFLIFDLNIKNTIIIILSVILYNILLNISHTNICQYISGLDCILLYEVLNLLIKKELFPIWYKKNNNLKMLLLIYYVVFIIKNFWVVKADIYSSIIFSLIVSFDPNNVYDRVIYQNSIIKSIEFMYIKIFGDKLIYVSSNRIDVNNKNDSLNTTNKITTTEKLNNNNSDNSLEEEHNNEENNINNSYSLEDFVVKNDNPDIDETEEIKNKESENNKKDEEKINNKEDNLDNFEI